jgi:HicA toxin of bacterial toxin-antitoxin,
MNTWGAAKSRRVLAALLRLGWTIKRESGSHRTLTRPGWPDFVFASLTARRSGRACSRASHGRRGSSPGISKAAP